MHEKMTINECVHSVTMVMLGVILGCIKMQSANGPGICKKYFFLVPSIKPVTKKTELNYAFTFPFLSDKIYNYTKKSHLALGNLAKLVFWSILWD